MKKGAILLITIAVLGVVAASQGGHYDQGGFCENQKTEARQCSCGAEKNGMQFCASISVSPRKDSADPQITVSSSLRNVGEKTVKIPAVGEVSDLYNISILTPSGHKLLSERQIRDKTAAERNELTNTPNSTKEPVGDGPVIRKLGPNEELKSEFNLIPLYKFASKGTYQIEISMKVPLEDGAGISEIPAGTFAIEIK